MKLFIQCLTISLLLMACATRVYSELISPIRSNELPHLIQKNHGHIVMIQIWATWCPPCVEEFPLLMKLLRQFRSQGFELILVSADSPSELSAVQAFLKEHQVDFPTYLKNEKDGVFIDALSKRWSGSLPASFIYDRKGNLIDFWEGESKADAFAKRVSRPFNP